MLEIIGMSVEDAKAIEAYGGERIELISALTEGGLTPSYGVIEAVVKSVKIPVNVMVRHHAKSFVYSSEDIKIMKKDIEVIKSLGANGVVLGLLKEDGSIDEESLKELLSVCDGLDVTFHRAIDDTKNPAKSVEVLNKYKDKITNILTSGGPGKAPNNTEVIKEMIKNADNINILLGSGMSLDNLSQVRDETCATDFHVGTDVRINNDPFGEIDKNRLKKLVSLYRNK